MDDLRIRLEERKAAMRADMNALAGAMQQIDWTLAQMDDIAQSETLEGEEA